MEWDVGWTSAVAASPAVRCARRETGTSVGEVRVRGTEAVAGRYPEARGRRFRLGCPSSVNSRGRTAFRSRTRSGRFHNPFVPRCCDTRTRQGRRVEKKERGWIRTCPTWGVGYERHVMGIRVSCRCQLDWELPLGRSLPRASCQPVACFVPFWRISLLPVISMGNSSRRRVLSAGSVGENYCLVYSCSGARGRRIIPADATRKTANSIFIVQI